MFALIRALLYSLVHHTVLAFNTLIKNSNLVRLHSVRLGKDALFHFIVIVPEKIECLLRISYLKRMQIIKTLLMFMAFIVVFTGDDFIWFLSSIYFILPSHFNSRRILYHIEELCVVNIGVGVVNKVSG